MVPARAVPTWSDAGRLIDWFLLSCIALGTFLGAAVFFLPYDLVADEGEYLDEIVSLARGEPKGWIIRSFVYPALLAPAVLISDALGFDDPESLTHAARLLNWVPAWLSAVLAYAIATRVHSRRAGLLAAIFLLCSWAWILNARRVMMDVPSAFWLVAALYFLLLGADRPRNVVLAVVAGSLAVFTKFQSAPATAMIGLLLIAAPSARGVRLRNLVLAASTAAGMLAIYAAVDVATYGAPFVSIVEFVRYNFSGAEFVAEYGACESLLYYATEGPANAYSYLFPILLAAGVVACLTSNAGSRFVLLVAAAQLLALHLTCHKQTRYLIQIAPLLAVMGSLGLMWMMDLLHRRLGLAHPTRRRGGAAKYVTALVFLTLVMATLISFVPRNEVRTILGARGACRSFVHSVLKDADPEMRAGRVALMAPCDVPSYYAEGWPIQGLSQGHNDYARARKLAQFRDNLPRYTMVFLETGSAPEHILQEEKSASFSLLARSPDGTYAAYVRNQASTP